MGKRERKARERERKRNIVALLLLLLLRRTAATVLEHVLPVLFALSFLGPTHTHLAHICALLLGLLGLLRVPDERVFAILVLVVVARAVAAPTVAANKTSSRVDADEKGLRTMETLSSRLWGKPSRREEDEEEEKEGAPKAERERERKTRNAKAHSKHPFSAREKAKEREREKRSPSKERSRNCRFCNEVFPFSRTNPSVAKETSRARKRARIVSRNYMTQFENNNAYFASPFVRNWLLRAIANEDDNQISCEIAHEFDDVSFRCELHSSTYSSQDDVKSTLIALVSVAFPKSNDEKSNNERVLTTREKFLSLSSSGAFERGRALGIIRKVRGLGKSDDAEEEEEEQAEFGYDATVEVDLKKLNEAEEKEEMIDLISSVRVYAGYGTLRACLRRLVVEEEEEEEEAKAKRRSFSLRRQFASPSVSMYCKVEEDDTLKEGAEERRSCTVVFPMHVSSSLSNNEDEVVIARAFLAHFAEASRNSAKLSAAPFVSYHKPGQKPPLELTTSVDATTRDGDEVDEMDLNANGGYVSFVIFPRHVKTKESLERAVWMLASFPNFIKSHLKCSKGYWHEKMRGKAEELLETLKRAQKEPKMSAKKKLISGRTYVPR